MKGIFYYIGIILFLTVSCKELEPKCCVKCEKENEQKYYSIDWLFNRCGECCLDPSQFWKFKIFEPGLTKADVDVGVCASLGYGDYEKTETHGIFSLKVTLDKYKKITNSTKQ